MATREIYHAASVLVTEYGAEHAPRMAARRFDALRKLGDVGGVMVWKGVLRAVLEILRAERRVDEQMN